MKYRQKHNRATVGSVTLSGLVLGLVLADQYEPPEALAGDDKIFAPHYCVSLEWESDRKEFESEFWREWVSGRLICPLVRDIVKGDLDAVWVRVRASNSSESADPSYCCVHSVSSLGGSSDFECQEADSPGELESIEFDLDNFEEYDNGHYVVTCELLNGGELYSIRTSESD